MSQATEDLPIDQVSLDDDYDSDDDRERRVAPAPASSSSSNAKKAPVAEKAPASSAAPDDDGQSENAAPRMKFICEESAKPQSFMAVLPWKGAIVAPTNPVSSVNSPPAQGLALQHIYGYSSLDSRNNVVLSKENIVYPAAAVGVVLPPSRTQKHFLAHTDEIRAVASTANGDYIATGQTATVINGKSSAPTIIVWRADDFANYVTITLPADDRAVRSLSFSSDGQYLASVSNDNYHTVRVWKWRERVQVANARGDTQPIYQIKFTHQPATEFTTVGKRHATFWKLEGSKLTSAKAKFDGAAPTCYTVCYSEKGYACVGTDTGNVIVFNAGKQLKNFSPCASKILTIEHHSGGLIVGNSKGQVIVLDSKMNALSTIQFTGKIHALATDNHKLVVGTSLPSIHEIPDFTHVQNKNGVDFPSLIDGHGDGELWGVAYTNNHSAITVGEDNAVILWDLDTHRVINRAVLSDKKSAATKILRAATASSFPPSQCARSVAVNKDVAAVGMNDGTVQFRALPSLQLQATVDLNTYSQAAKTQQNWIQCMSFSPNSQFLAVGTHGSVIVILDMQHRVRSVVKSHHAAITHIDWSSDSTVLRSNCLAYELLFHRLSSSDASTKDITAQQVTRVTELRDTAWATTTCPFTYYTEGLHNEDGSDINSIDARSDKQIIVTGDDSGKVNLLRFPAVEKGHIKHRYVGHSSHVSSVVISPAGDHVLSAGGADRCLFQWQLTAYHANDAKLPPTHIVTQ